MNEKIIYELDIKESITAKQRPRMNTKTGRAYTPTKTKNYEFLVRQLFVYKYPNFKPIEEKVKMEITAYFELPKSASKKEKDKMLEGFKRPTKKPDWDNVGKIVSDALNKFAFNDDSQIVEALIIKKYDIIPHVFLKIEEL